MNELLYLKTAYVIGIKVNKAAGIIFKQQTFDSVGMSCEGDMSGIIFFNEAFNQFEAIHA